jgi:hypothetical protein
MVVVLRLRPLFLGILIASAAFSLSHALVTTDGVGPIEYATGIALVSVLVAAAYRATRRAIHRA